MQMNKAARSAEVPTAQMYLECQELLQMFGIPYIVAPTEVRGCSTCLATLPCHPALPPCLAPSACTPTVGTVRHGAWGPRHAVQAVASLQVPPAHACTHGSCTTPMQAEAERAWLGAEGLVEGAVTDANGVPLLII